MSALPDFSDIFQRYLELRGNVDALFASISRDFPDCVKCKEGCSDCCHALFDLSLVEAVYLNSRFKALFPLGAERSAILSSADEADRKAYKLKRKLYKDSQAGRDSNEILEEVGRTRLRCPLLGADDRCRIYAERPITCRVYGVPANIAGQAHSCGLSGFAPGRQYPTISLDSIQARLQLLSQELADLVRAQGGRYSALHEIFVPVSMALINEYDAAYLGLGPAAAPKS